MPIDAASRVVGISSGSENELAVAPRLRLEGGVFRSETHSEAVRKYPHSFKNRYSSS